MSWICGTCNSNNDDDQEQCFVCGAPRAEALRPVEAVTEKATDPESVEHTESSEESSISRDIDRLRSIIDSISRKTGSSFEHLYRPKKRSTIARKKASKMFAIAFPILMFLIGQGVMYGVYVATGGQTVWGMNGILDRIPMGWIAFSTIGAALWTAAVAASAYIAADDSEHIRAMAICLVSGGLLVGIPCWVGSLGLILCPLYLLLMRSDSTTVKEYCFRALSILFPILVYAFGQFVMYDLYFVFGRVLLLDVMVEEISVGALIASSVFGGVALCGTIYLCWNKSDDWDFGTVTSVLTAFAAAYGAFAAMAGFFGWAVIAVVIYQYRTLNKEYAPATLTVAAFVIGQVLMYWYYCISGRVLFLTDLLVIAGNYDFLTQIYLAGMTILGAAGTYLTAKLGYYYYSERDRRGSAYLLVVLVGLPMLICPALASAPIVLVVGVLSIGKDNSTMRKLVPACVGMVWVAMLACAIASWVPPQLGQTYTQDGIVYYKGADGRYYVTDYVGEKCDYLYIPTRIRKDYSVGGLDATFLKRYEAYALELDYEHATAETEIHTLVVFDPNSQPDLPVPTRGEDTFYGWWDSENRHWSQQITDEDGKTMSLPTTSGVLHAMWYGSDYTFLDANSDMDEIKRDGKYVLTEDIVVEGYYQPIFEPSDTIQEKYGFQGVLDGNYHTITYSIRGGYVYSGLFGLIGGNGLVRNLNVHANINIDHPPFQQAKKWYSGGIAALNCGRIRNCRVTGNIRIKVDNGTVVAGGLIGVGGVGDVLRGSVMYSSNYADIQVETSGQAIVGGIMGEASRTSQSIMYAYNRGKMYVDGNGTLDTAVGGIVGYGSLTLAKCLNAGDVMSVEKAGILRGGIIGNMPDRKEPSYFPKDCIWIDSDTSMAQAVIGKYEITEGEGVHYGTRKCLPAWQKHTLHLLNGTTEQFVTTEQGEIVLAWEVRANFITRNDRI